MGHDGYYVALFDSGITATSDTGWAEVYYAQASDRIAYALPVVNGFSVSVSIYSRYWHLIQVQQMREFNLINLLFMEK